MAITKIWAVKDDLRRVLNYIENPDKTKEELSDGLKEVLAYTTQGYKTNEKEYRKNDWTYSLHGNVSGMCTDTRIFPCKAEGK